MSQFTGEHPTSTTQSTNKDELHVWYNTLMQVPAARFLSPASKAALKAYVEAARSEQQNRLRETRLLEFFKAVDWLSVNDISPNPLTHLTDDQRQQILNELNEYLAHKANQKQHRRQQQKAYRLNVFDYFRQTVSSADKALLEDLRDYELEQTGQDVNWRHYFLFKSYKQIDRFVEQTPAQRQVLLAQFRSDVKERKKNQQRLEDGSYAEYYWGTRDEQAFKAFQKELDNATQDFFKQRPNATEASDLPRTVKQALTDMKLPVNSSFTQVRQQFRQLTLAYHPDRPEGCPQKMKALLEAYATLKDWYNQPIA